MSEKDPPPPPPSSSPPKSLHGSSDGKRQASDESGSASTNKNTTDATTTTSTAAVDEANHQFLQNWLQQAGGATSPTSAYSASSGEPPQQPKLEDQADDTASAAAASLIMASKSPPRDPTLPPRGPVAAAPATTNKGVLKNSPKLGPRKTTATANQEEPPAAASADSEGQGTEGSSNSNNNSNEAAAAEQKKPTHQRLVSWGDQRKLVGEIPSLLIPPAARQPLTELHRGSSEASSLSAPGDRNVEDVLRQPPPPPPPPLVGRSSTINTTGWSSINVRDVLKVNPLESEAETLILKAIEKQDAVVAATEAADGRPRANTGASLLGSIPDQAASLFSHDDSAASAGGRSGGDSARLSPASGQRPPLVRPATGPPPSDTSSLPAGGSRGSDHRRMPTAEGKLANLTAALMHLHTDNMEQDLVQDIPTAENANASSGEALVQNANLLFRGKSERKFGALSPKPGTPKKWNLLKNAVRMSGAARPPSPPLYQQDSSSHHKKTDGGIGSSERIEEGHDEDGDVEAADGSLSSLDGDNIQTENTGDGGNNEDGAPTGGDGATQPVSTSSGKKKKRKKNVLASNLVRQTGAVRDFQTFLGQRRSSFFAYSRFVLLVVLPAFVVSGALFYFAGNPPTGRVDFELSRNDLLINTENEIIDPNQASTSWFITFIFIRQVLTFSLAKLLQVFIIDFLCLSTRLFVRLFGNLATLLIVQSKGWPFMILMWAVLDFGLLHGTSRFVSHWWYWQDFAPIFNDENPSGNITSNSWNTKLLSVAIGVGAATAIKRLWLGLYLGKQTYANYAEDLTKVVKKILMLSEVATVARDCRIDALSFGSSRRRSIKYGLGKEFYEGMAGGDEDSTMRGVPEMNDTSYHGGFIIDPGSNPDRVVLTLAQRTRVNELLGAWEDPEEEIGADENISISSILQFRQSLSFLENRFMFSIAFGDCGTRDRMVLSSQEVYRRLLLRSPDPELLNFDVLAPLAERSDGTLDNEKMKDLIRLLRPDRDGNLSLLDFVKSVDSVFKEAKLLRASVKNSEKIDRALEKIFNVAFYTVVGCIVLSRLGIDPLALFLSLSSVIVAFAFAIGSASAKMFEGILFILIRRPYGIGDRIHISNPESDTSATGSAGWIVKDVTLYHTTAVFATTNERATISNGALASSRVINMARSPNAIAYIYLKFAVSVSYERVKIFDQAVRQFVKARPREWANFMAFRQTQIAADLGYAEFVAVIMHREPWQNVGAFLNSKAEVTAFCLELSRKLDMRFQSPPLPVDLALVRRGSGSMGQQQPQEGRESLSGARGSSGSGGSGSPKLSPSVSEDVSGYSEVAAMFGHDSISLK